MTDSGFPPLPSNPNEDASDHILGATLAVTALAFLTVATRFFVRATMVKALGWDDWLMALAMIVSLSTQVVIVLGVKHGAGRHIGDVPFNSYSQAMMYNYIQQQLFLAGICVVKLSVGCALLRIAVQRLWRRIIISIMVFMTLYSLGCFVANFFFCERLSMIWDGSFVTAGSKCFSPQTLQALAFTHASLNIITDILFAVVIPVCMLWKLQLNGRTKAAVLLMLSLGLFVCLAAILRIPEILNFGKQGDFLWSNKDFLIWFMAEFNIGIIAGSMPALKPLFKVVFKKTSSLGTRRSTGPRRGSSHNSIAKTPSNRWRSNQQRKDVAGFRDIERQDSAVQFDDNDAASQRNLVDNSGTDRDIPLGAIQKSVTTTVTALPAGPTSGLKRQNW